MHGGWREHGWGGRLSPDSRGGGYGEELRGGYGRDFGGRQEADLHGRYSAEPLGPRFSVAGMGRTAAAAGNGRGAARGGERIGRWERGSWAEQAGYDAPYRPAAGEWW